MMEARADDSEDGEGGGSSEGRGGGYGVDSEKGVSCQSIPGDCGSLFGAGALVGHAESFCYPAGRGVLGIHHGHDLIEAVGIKSVVQHSCRCLEGDTASAVMPIE